ncbi:MAG: response regulator transcription factor [Pyrinomonadaceae bacterium]
MSRRRRSAGDVDGEAASVFVVAASDVVRAGLVALIEADARFTVAGRASDFGELTFEGAERTPPDLVVVDAERRAEELRGALRAFAEEAEEGGTAPAFVVIGVEDAERAEGLLRAGPLRALLPRGVSGDAILAALGAASAGLVALDPDTFSALLSTASRTSGEPGDAGATDERLLSAGAEFDALTPREREVLDMLASGLSNKEIAWRMKISEHTVKSHVASIFAKLNVSTRTEAVTQGIRKGLVMM